MSAFDDAFAAMPLVAILAASDLTKWWRSRPCTPRALPCRGPANRPAPESLQALRAMGRMVGAAQVARRRRGRRRRGGRDHPVTPNTNRVIRGGERG